MSTNKFNMTVVSQHNAAGQKEGMELQYYYNGALAVSRHFKAGLREGRTILFFSTNIFTKPLTVQKIIYFKNEQQHGKFYSFYENGHLEFVQQYYQGNIIGNAYFFDDRGRLKCRERFGPQERIMAYACYDSLGRLTRSGAN